MRETEIQTKITEALLRTVERKQPSEGNEPPAGSRTLQDRWRRWRTRRREPDGREDEGTRRQWEVADPYLLRHLAAHAAVAGQLPELVNDADYLINAEPDRLLDVLGSVNPAEHPLVRVYWRAAHHLRDAEVADRANVLRTTAIVDEPEAVGRFTTAQGQPLTLRWARVKASHFHRTLYGHTGSVNALTFLPLADGTTLLASAGEDGHVRLWDPVRASPRTTLLGHASNVEALASINLPDGTTLLASAGGTVRLWDLSTLTPHAHLTDPASRIYSLAFTTLPDGTPLLAGGDRDGVIWLWDPVTATLRGSFHGHRDVVQELAFTTLPDGTTLLASTGNDHAVRLWDLVRGGDRPRATLEGHQSWVYGLAFITGLDGDLLLVSGDTRGKIHVWNPLTGTSLKIIEDRSTWVTTLSVTTLPDGHTLTAIANLDYIVLSRDHIVLSRDLFSSDTVSLTGHTAWVSALAFDTSPGNVPVMASGGDDHTVRLWDPTMPISQDKSSYVLSDVYALASTVGPDGAPLLVSGGNQQPAPVQSWDLDTAAPRVMFHGHDSQVYGLALTTLPDGTLLLASVGHDQTVRLWDPTTGSPGFVLTGHTGSLSAVTFAVLPDGTPVLASAGRDNASPKSGRTRSEGLIRLWDPLIGTPRAILTGHTHNVNALAATTLPDGTPLLASAGVNRSVCLWDLGTSQPRQALEGHTSSVEALAFTCLSGDGTVILASAGYDTTVRLWDAVTGTHRATLTGHTGWVSALAFGTRPDGTVVLASGGYDGTIRLWDPATGRAIASIAVSMTVQALVFAGDLLVAGTGRGLLALDW